MRLQFKQDAGRCSFQNLGFASKTHPDMPGAKGPRIPEKEPVSGTAQCWGVWGHSAGPGAETGKKVHQLYWSLVPRRVGALAPEGGRPLTAGGRCGQGPWPRRTQGPESWVREARMPQVVGVGDLRPRCSLHWQKVGVSLSLWKRPEAKADGASRPYPWAAACPRRPRPCPGSASWAPSQGPCTGLQGPNPQRLVPGHGLVAHLGSSSFGKGLPRGRGPQG